MANTLDVIKGQLKDMKETAEYAVGLRSREDYRPMGNAIDALQKPDAPDAMVHRESHSEMEKADK